ncbi:MAG: pyridoxamine 5'-phosphate oxidase family protein [Bacteroidetes bacterium]|nr:pyridoxamine 5'-phosphate oxidase family protein [Bacteroidota bacterium]
MSEVIELQEEIREKILELYKNNNAVMLATAGGEYSPWILGAYFASSELDLYLLLETHGKTMANIIKNKNIALSISQNDAMQDFLQAKGEAEIMDDSKEPEVRKMILDKMPWFQTFTPVKPVRIKLSKIFVSSLQNSWFPAKVLDVTE